VSNIFEVFFARMLHEYPFLYPEIFSFPGFFQGNKGTDTGFLPGQDE